MVNGVATSNDPVVDILSSLLKSKSNNNTKFSLFLYFINFFSI